MDFNDKEKDERIRILEDRIKKRYINPSIANSILLVILTILVVFAANNIYLVALISIIPMTILSMRANLVYTISSLVVLGGLAYIVGGPGQMSLIMLVYLLPSALSGLMYGKELVSKIARYPKIGVYMKGTGKEILSFINIKFFFISIVVYVLGIGAYYAFMKYSMGIDLVKEMQVFFDKFVKAYINNLSQDEINKLNQVGFIDQLKNISSMIPVFVFLRAVTLAFMSYYLAPALANRAYEKKILNIPISMIVLPGNPVIFMFVSIVMLFSIGWFYKDLNLDIVINNFIIVMNILFFLEGASLFVFIIKKWEYIRKKVNWFLVLGLTIIMGVLPGIAIIGMLDNMMNFRERWLPLIGGNDER